MAGNEVVIRVRAEDAASKELDKIQNKVGVGLKAATAVGAGAVVAGFVSSVNAAANFEKAVDQVGAVANATSKEMDGLSDTALKIGKNTAFSATEAAAAMEMLAANGVSVADIMNGAADATVALAAAGGTDLTTAADTASTAMAVWSLKAGDMAEVVNRLAGAANVSRFGVEDMSLAIAAGGGAAASAGVEFDDFSTAIAAIAPSFSSGQDAGTSFKQMIAGLTPSSAPAKKALKQLGIITEEAGNRFFDAQGNLKSFGEITGILHDALQGLSEEQKAQALETIFGSDAMRAAAAVSALTTEQFNEMSASMKNTDAAAVAAARMSNFQGAMESLKGTIEVLQIQLGEKFIPILTMVANALATHPQLLTAIAAVIAGVVVAAITAWTVATIAHTAALIAQGIAMTIAYAPMILIAAAILAVVAAIYLAITHWSEIKAVVMDAVNAMLSFVSENWPLIVGIMMGPIGIIVALMATHWGEVKSIIGGAITAVKNAIIGGLSDALAWLSNHWPLVATLIAGPFAPLVAIATDAFGVRSALIGAFGDVIEFMSQVATRIIEIVTRIIEAVNAAIAAVARLPSGNVTVGAFGHGVTLGTGGVSFKAVGGPVYSGKPYVVGERGPELFVPRGSGTIVPNNKMGGGNLTVSVASMHVTNYGDERDITQQLADIAFGMKAQLRARGVV